MYDFIEGNIDRISPTSVVLENNGIGYSLSISLQTYEKIKSEKAIRLFVEMAFKVENQAPVASMLFGFFETEEREMFNLLTSVSGVGKNTGMLMLSALEPEILHSAILNGNVGLLKSIKGIGEKSAQRIVLELRDKLGGKGIKRGFLAPAGTSDMVLQASAALQTLGYTATNIEKVMNKLAKQSSELNVEQLIKEALKLL